MAVTKVNARDWTVEYTADESTFVEIGGINSFTIEHDQVEADTTDFNSDGNEEHEIMQRGKSLSLEGFFLEDESAGTRDAGQEAVETLAEATGSASLGTFRFTSPGGTAKSGQFSASLGGTGGGHNDKTSWSVTLKRSGAES